MVEQLLQLLQGLPSWLVVLAIAATPVLELRGAIPVALGVYHLQVWYAVVLAVAGNMIPALVVVLGWDGLVRWLERHSPSFHSFMSRHHDRLHTRWQDKIDRYGPWALALFVAVPLPMSGVWSGALIAWIFGLHRLAALASIFLGVVAAATIVAMITTGALHVF